MLQLVGASYAGPDPDYAMRQATARINERLAAIPGLEILSSPHIAVIAIPQADGQSAYCCTLALLVARPEPPAPGGKEG